MGFYLFHDKVNGKMEIGKIKEKYMASYIQPGGIVDYNGHYLVSDDRKLLRLYAVQLKAKWILDLNDEIQRISAIQVKNKY